MTSSPPSARKAFNIGGMDHSSDDGNPHDVTEFSSLFQNTLQNLVTAEQRDGMFTYTPLQSNQIRIMELQPETDDDHAGSISCVLLDVDPAILPFYEYLSYCWGSTDEGSGTIICNGQPLLITRQLLTALWCVRAGMRQLRLIWVDQICINKSDLDEKSSQVARMGAIYSGAARVLLFPGIDRRHAEAFVFCMDFCEAYAHDFFNSETSAFRKAWSSLSSKELYRMANIPQPEDNEWVAVRALLSSPCFRRTWIVQELVLAKEVRVILLKEEFLFDWENYTGFGSFMTMLNERWTKIGDDYVGQVFHVARVMFSVRSVRLLSPDSHVLKLMGLLNVTRDLEYTDPRDKIYGLLSLASDGEQLGIVPNYREGIQSCYTVAAKKIISESRSLQLLLSCQTLQQHPTWPTWVPDWIISRLENFPYPIPESTSDKTPFKATLELRPSMRDIGDEKKLGLQGIFIDKITSITQGPTDTQDLDFYLENVYGYGTWWLRAYDAIGSVYKPTGESLPRALGRTRIADDQSQELRDNPNLWSACKVRESEAVDALRSKDNYFLEISAKILVQTLFRNLFTTNRKYMGLAPLSAEEGDMVFLLPGADVPYVLRQVDGPEYQLIGQCYTHGIMFGEAADPDLLQDIVLI